MNIIHTKGHHSASSVTGKNNGSSPACQAKRGLYTALDSGRIDNKIRSAGMIGAEHLFRIACENDFTLYEFFQTDVAGHSMDYARACAVLRVYDRFLAALVHLAEAAGITLVMTSDHGNIEAIGERGHTRNPVPFVVFGPQEQQIRDRVSSLVDVMPSLLKAFG